MIITLRKLYRNAAAVVGDLWLSWITLKVVKYFVEEFHAFVLAPWGIFRTNLKKYGQWAGETVTFLYLSLFPHPQSISMKLHF